jgi:hypothetical protein
MMYFIASKRMEVTIISQATGRLGGYPMEVAFITQQATRPRDTDVNIRNRQIPKKRPAI